jgi:hypothetical protein
LIRRRGGVKETLNKILLDERLFKMAIAKEYKN